MAASSYTRRFARNAGIVVLARVWSIAQWIVVTPFVLHHLGTERFGVWSLLFLLSGYLATFDLGLGASVVKFTAQHAGVGEWTRLRVTLAQINRLYVFLAAVWIVVVFAASPWILDWLKVGAAHRDEVRFAVLASAVIFAFANLVSVGTGLLNGLQRMDLANSIVVGASIPQIVVLLAGLQAGWGLYAVVLSTALQWAIVSVLTWTTARRVAPEASWPSWRARGEAGGWFRFSSAMQFVNLLHLTQQQLDKIFLTTWIGLSAVTPFELAFRVANAAQSLPVIVLLPLVPAIADLYERGDRERLRRICYRGTTLLFAAAGLLAAAGVAAAPLAVRGWVGDGYPQAQALASWMTAAFAVNLMTGVGTSTVRAAGRPALEAVPALIALTFHALASAWLVSRYGVAGVGPALLLAMIVWAGLFLGRFARWLGEPASRLILPPLYRCLAAFVPALLLGRAVAARWPVEASAERVHTLEGAAFSGSAAALLFAAIWWVAPRFLPALGPRETSA